MVVSIPSIEFFEGIREDLSNVSLKQNRSTGVHSVHLTFTKLRALEQFRSFTRSSFNSMRLTDSEGMVEVEPSSAQLFFGGEDGDELARFEFAFEVEREDHLQRFMRFMQRYAESEGLAYSPKGKGMELNIFRHLLVAVDDSGESVRLAKSLLALSPSGNRAVTLLHVIPATQFTAMPMEARLTEGRRVLDGAREILSQEVGLTVTERLAEGDPKTKVLEVADEVDASAIAMGGRSLPRLQAILSDSLSQYVFQLSTRPLVLIRDGLQMGSISRAMVALDGSAASKQALKIAIDLMEGLKERGEILLARIQTDLEAASHQPTEIDPKRDDSLAAAVAKLQPLGIPYRICYATGDPGPEIVRLAQDSAADLLVMGSPDRRPNIARSLPDLERLLGKSVSDYVRVHAPCPVLMTRPQVS